ncbi:MAG: hypothetical protein ACO3FE_21630, partial [Planctomycetaceae bacterium]
FVACWQVWVFAHGGIPVEKTLREAFEPFQTETVLLFSGNIFRRFGRGWQHVPVHKIFSASDNSSLASALDILHHAMG